jgi:hypothetical protein
LSARHKLNSACLFGCTIVAAIVAWLFQSWMVFGITAIVLLAAATHAGGNRLGGGGGR